MYDATDSFARESDTAVRRRDRAAFCHAEGMVDSPLDLFMKSQQLALGLAADTLRLVRDTAVTGVTQPDQLVKQVAELATAVASMTTAITGIASSTAQPLQDFIVRQRELADTVSALADAQADLAGVVASLAERHADVVAALEKVTAPVFAIVGTDPTPPKGRSSAARRKGGPSAAATP